MVTQYQVRLTAEQRRVCNDLLRGRHSSPRARRRALVLLHADHTVATQHPTDETIASAAGVDPRTVARVRSAFVRHGFDVALHGRPRRTPAPSKLTPAQEARLLALTATPPPMGYPRWTIRTLAESMRQIADMPQVSRELVRRTLNRHNAGAKGQAASLVAEASMALAFLSQVVTIA